MNRTDFQQLADVRIEEAAILLAQKKWDGAYYLCGYAVECALKACIAKQTKEFDFPPPRKEWEDSYTHDFDRLLRRALLETRCAADKAADARLDVNWDVVVEWNESCRYKRKTQAEAETLYNAITDAGHGVLPWIKKLW